MKMIMKFNKEKVKLICLMLVLFSIVFTSNVYATTISLDVELTEEYLEWYSSEDKRIEDMPRTYGIEVPETILNNAGDNYLGSILENKGANVLKLKNVSAAATDSRYNLAEHINIRIKNQMLTSECWAFALISSLESNNLIREGKTEFYSERHMDYATSKSFTDGTNPMAFNRQVGSGGLSAIGLAYLTNGQGAILESDMPFENNEQKISIKEIDKEVVRVVTDYEVLPTIYKRKNANGSLSYYDALGNPYTEAEVESIRTYIKSVIIEHGAIATVTAGSHAEYYSDPENPIEAGAYFCDNYSITRDHAITIVGWDDNYSKENFNLAHRPTTDGAYIVLNSYGPESFDKGYMYVSYEDVLIETDMYVIQGSSKKDYDKLYQYDEFGGMFAVGTTAQNTGFYGAKFKRDASKAEILDSVGVTVEDYVKVEIYVNAKNTDMSQASLTLVGTSDVLEPGYHEIKIDPTKLEGEEYAVVIKQISETGKFYVTIETSCTGTPYSHVKSSGNSYISFDGHVWYNVNEVSVPGLEMKNADVCIKAFTTFDTIIEDDTDDDEIIDDGNKDDNTEDEEFEDIEDGQIKDDDNKDDDNKDDDNKGDDNKDDNTEDEEFEDIEDGQIKDDDNKDDDNKDDDNKDDDNKDDDNGNKIILESTVYKIENSKIFKIEHSTNKDDFILNLVSDYNIVILNEKGEDVTKNTDEPLIRSGMKIKLENGTEYTLIVRGDTNCDGKITLTDLSKLVLEYNETKGFRLEGVALDSGDLNCDGKLTLTDLSQLLVIYTNL